MKLPARFEEITGNGRVIAKTETHDTNFKKS